MATKNCHTCKETKPLEEFHVRSAAPDGRQHSCKVCRSKLKKTYRDANKDRINSQSREYKAANRDKIRQYREENSEALNATTARWKRENKDRVNAANAKRRALKKSLTVEPVDYKVIRDRDESCYLCGELFTDTERFDGTLTHVDHKLPLDRIELAPTHSYENCALTHASCNIKKGTMTPEEYWEAQSSSL